jgi:hypothetical protein
MAESKLTELEKLTQCTNAILNEPYAADFLNTLSCVKSAKEMHKIVLHGAGLGKQLLTKLMLQYLFGIEYTILRSPYAEIYKYNNLPHHEVVVFHGSFFDLSLVGICEQHHSETYHVYLFDKLKEISQYAKLDLI